MADAKRHSSTIHELQLCINPMMTATFKGRQTCAFLSRSMVRASQSGQQVSSSRVMRAKASMDPLSCRNMGAAKQHSSQRQAQEHELKLC